MIFTEVRFVFLVIGCWLSFFAVPRRFRAAVLAAWGIVFYATYAGAFFPLVAELVLAAYLVGRGRGDLVLIGIVALLFTDFKLGLDLMGLSSVSRLRATPGAVLIPLGFSFLGFELIHYAIECRRGRVPEASLIDLGAFAFYFPCRIAGPIKRYPAFMKDVAIAENSPRNVYSGVVRVLIGIFKKFVLADVLALTASEVLYAATPLHVWKVTLAYSLQIYLDFSAYSDMAIGTSRILGIAVPENFDWPYLSPNIQEFWKRWHMTLSGWARDYVFTPLGRALFKTRLKSWPTLIAALSYLTTFGLIGAWHGLGPNFLVWGVYHGLLLTGYHIYRKRIPATIVNSR